MNRFVTLPYQPEPGALNVAYPTFGLMCSSVTLYSETVPDLNKTKKTNKYTFSFKMFCYLPLLSVWVRI